MHSCKKLLFVACCAINKKEPSECSEGKFEEVVDMTPLKRSLILYVGLPVLGILTLLSALAGDWEKFAHNMSSPVPLWAVLLALLAGAVLAECSPRR